MLEIAYNLRSRKITKSKFVRTHGITRSKFVRTQRPPPWIAGRMVEESAGEKLPEKSGEKLPEQQVTTAPASPRSKNTLTGKQGGEEPHVQEKDDDVSHIRLKNFHDPASEGPFGKIIPKPVTMEETIRGNRKKWATWATKVLEHYNFKEDANFKLVEVTCVQLNLLSPRFLVHMNFRAQSLDATTTELFFAELFVLWKNDDTQVEGCCLLEKVDAGNPNSKPCFLCRNIVIHPGPWYGYRCAKGDDFSNLDFSY